MLEYHEGELGEPARERLERHLLRCRGCREYLQALDADLRMIRQGVGEAPEPPPAAKLWQGIEERLPAGTRRPVLVVWARTATAACVVLMAAIGVVLFAWRTREPAKVPQGRPALVAPTDRHASRLPKWWVDGVEAGAGVVVLAGQNSTDVKAGDIFRVFALGKDGKGMPKRTWWCDVVVVSVRPAKLICRPKPKGAQSASQLISGIKKGWQAVRVTEPR